MEAGAEEMEASAGDARARRRGAATSTTWCWVRAAQVSIRVRTGTAPRVLVTARRACSTKLPAAHLCVCSNGEPCAAGGPDRAAADSASVPAPPGVSPNPAWPCALASQKPQPHSSRHAKYNPVDSAGRSSDSQCGQARRRAMRGRAHCSTHHTRGRALFEW